MSADGSLDGSNMIRLRAEMCAPSTISLIDSDLLSDIVFVCGDDFVPIKSHKLILRNWSTFFSKIVECTLSIQGPFPVAPVIVLKEVPGKDLQDILTFIYTGNLVVEQSRIQSILKTAKFLELERLPEQLEASEMVKASQAESIDTEMDQTPVLTEPSLPIEMCPPPPQDEMDPLPSNELNSPNQTGVNSPMTEVNSLTDVASVPPTDLSSTPSHEIDSSAQSENPPPNGLAGPSKKAVNPSSRTAITLQPLPEADRSSRREVDPQIQSETESSSLGDAISPSGSENNEMNPPFPNSSSKTTPFSRNSNGTNNHSPSYNRMFTSSNYFFKRNFEKNKLTEISSMKRDKTIPMPRVEIHDGNETIDLTDDE